MHALKQAVAAVAGAIKPQQQQPQQSKKQSSPSSNADAKPGRKPSSTQPLKPTSQTPSGVTHRDAEQRQRVEKERDRLLSRAAHATDILEDMNAPKDSESPTQLQEIATMLNGIMEVQARIEAELKEQRRLLSAVLRPRG